MSDRPIFIIGTERSGSNLLRLILNAHSDVYVPHPPHVLHFLSDVPACGGDLVDDGAFLSAAKKVAGLVDRHIHPWDGRPDPRRLCALAQERSLVGLFLALYDDALGSMGKSRWGCKSTFVLHHVDAVLRLRPAAQFILLVRDPRDVAVSSRRSVFNPFHPYFTAKLWNDQQQEALRLIGDLPPRTLHLLHYEALLDAPEEEVGRICEFLDLPFQSSLLNHSATPDAAYTAGLSESWKNAAQPIISGNHGRFRTDLTPRETAWVEAVAGATMDRLGYRRAFHGEEGVGSSPATIPVRWWFGFLNLVSRFRVEWNSIRRDRNHFLRWRRRLWIMGLKARSGGRVLSWTGP